MSYSLSELEGVNEEILQKLDNQDIYTTYDLLLKANTLKKQEDLALRTNIPLSIISRFASLADLLRIKGVMNEYAELLEAAGIKNVSMFKQADPDKLSQVLVKLNGEKKLTNHTPTRDIMRTLVERAQELPDILENMKDRQ